MNGTFWASSVFRTGKVSMEVPLGDLSCLSNSGLYTPQIYPVAVSCGFLWSVVGLHAITRRFALGLALCQAAEAAAVVSWSILPCTLSGATLYFLQHEQKQGTCSEGK